MEEAHPIPQNVTSFQFKLVGDMTLKQFIYLASGAGLAYLTFVTWAVAIPFLAWPIIIISSLLGIAFAFLPLYDRPLDHWVKAFFRAVFSPTKRVWKKGTKTYKEDPTFFKRWSLYVASYTQPLENKVILPVVAAASAGQTPSPTIPVFTPAQPLPSPEQLSKTVSLAKEAQTIQLKIVEKERELEALKQGSQSAANPQLYTQQANQLIAQLNSLVSQSSQLKAQLDQINKKAAEKPTVLTPIVTPLQTRPKPISIRLTSTPNVINGVVFDQSGNYLEGVVVVIYDKEGLPVRALKTNKLGQFTGSTPLPNGVYKIEVEKESFHFDVLQTELKGGVLPALTVAAK